MRKVKLQGGYSWNRYKEGDGPVPDGVCLVMLDPNVPWPQPMLRCMTEEEYESYLKQEENKKVLEELCLST